MKVLQNVQCDDITLILDSCVARQIGGRAANVPG